MNSPEVCMDKTARECREEANGLRISADQPWREFEPEDCIHLAEVLEKAANRIDALNKRNGRLLNQKLPRPKDTRG